MSNLITGDLTRTGPFFKSPMDVSICRCFVLKQISLTENNLSILYLGLGVCVWGGRGGGYSCLSLIAVVPGAKSGKEVRVFILTCLFI